MNPGVGYSDEPTREWGQRGGVRVGRDDEGWIGGTHEGGRPRVIDVEEQHGAGIHDGIEATYGYVRCADEQASANPYDVAREARGERCDGTADAARHVGGEGAADTALAGHRVT